MQVHPKPDNPRVLPPDPSSRGTLGRCSKGPRIPRRPALEGRMPHRGRHRGGCSVLKRPCRGPWFRVHVSWRSVKAIRGTAKTRWGRRRRDRASGTGAKATRTGIWRLQLESPVGLNRPGQNFRNQLRRTRRRRCFGGPGLNHRPWRCLFFYSLNEARRAGCDRALWLSAQSKSQVENGRRPGAIQDQPPM